MRSANRILKTEDSLAYEIFLSLYRPIFSAISNVCWPTSRNKKKSRLGVLNLSFHQNIIHYTLPV
jgi:hypothetical protein